MTANPYCRRHDNDAVKQNALFAPAELKLERSLCLMIMQYLTTSQALPHDVGPAVSELIGGGGRRVVESARYAPVITTAR